MIPLRSFGFVCAAVSLAANLSAAEPAIIGKARSFLGTEAALTGVKSVRYSGTVVTTFSNEPAKPLREAVEIIVQKPDQQRVTATSDKSIEINGLDGYEGWQRVQDAANPKNWRQVVFKPDVLKRIRAQARENLMFFGGLERMGGRYEDGGSVTIDGVACQKIGFVHAPGIVFQRIFDAATGRLVQTETDDGTITRESGEIVTNGVRFPKSMTITSKLPDGRTKVTVITFDSITVNENFPARLFAVPTTER